MTVYEVLYCDCIFESGYCTISLHRTKAGAVRAMQKFKLEIFYSYRGSDQYESGFDGFKYGKMEVQD